MCGILGLLLANEEENINQLLFDGLTVLQHRGQDASGMTTFQSSINRLHLHKGNGLVKDVFTQEAMMSLLGNVGLGHVRYPTAGTSSSAEAQPMYTSYPWGVSVVHNGNLVNAEELRCEVLDKYQRHVDTDSDSELLLNIFAEELVASQIPHLSSSSSPKMKRSDIIFHAIERVMAKCKGGYACLYYINRVGLIGMRDPHGIRPVLLGSKYSKNGKTDYIMASESVAVDTLGFNLLRDIQPGEAIFIDTSNKHHIFHSQKCHANSSLTPCIFEYVYFARPDSILDGVSVYTSRLNMGEKLAKKIQRLYPNHNIDAVIPIPDTSRTSALQLSYILDRPFREGFIKNRYIARTFLMSGQATRTKSVRLKLNTVKSEFQGRNVLLVDDSIVRGTTASSIIKMAREAGAKKVFFASAAPPIRYPNIYGIDIPTQKELVAFGRNEEEISSILGCDWVVFQDIDDLKGSIRDCLTSNSNETLRDFDTSCFTGTYVTGECITDSYFHKLHELRNDDMQEKSRRAIVKK